MVEDRHDGGIEIQVTERDGGLNGQLVVLCFRKADDANYFP